MIVLIDSDFEFWIHSIAPQSYFHISICMISLARETEESLKELNGFVESNVKEIKKQN